jgi:hypothetical protein
MNAQGLGSDPSDIVRFHGLKDVVQVRSDVLALALARAWPREGTQASPQQVDLGPEFRW